MQRTRKGENANQCWLAEKPYRTSWTYTHRDVNGWCTILEPLRYKRLLLRPQFFSPCVFVCVLNFVRYIMCGGENRKHPVSGQRRTMGENLRTPGFPRRDERVGVVPVVCVLCWNFFFFSTSWEKYGPHDDYNNITKWVRCTIHFT